MNNILLYIQSGAIEIIEALTTPCPGGTMIQASWRALCQRRGNGVASEKVTPFVLAAINMVIGGSGRDFRVQLDTSND